uniref:Capsid protein n=1 Tax=Cressdnaviricota sp. TaxID=2748378 RepID=A0A6M9Z7C9_9VIRU|nr:MAG: capsid protein [Cressdnaviricota sp.]QKN88875.1 MAG: capsid protein [Cressdnaviricota sp.]
MVRRVYKPRLGFRGRRRGYGRSRFQSRVWARRAPRYRVSRKGYRSMRFNKVHRSLGGFSPTKNVSLRYVETVTLNPSDGVSAVNVFCANNIFDPNYTGTGHQPMFYDNYASLYGKYRVNYATCTMVALDNHIVNAVIQNTTSGTTTGTTYVYGQNERASRMFILMDESPTDYPNDLDNLIEEGNKRLRWRYAPQTTSSAMQKIRAKAYPASMMNLSYRDDSLASSFGSGPAKPLFFICGVDSMDADNADTMNYQVFITYNVTMFDFIGNQTQN